MQNFIRKMHLGIILVVAWWALPCTFWEANAQDSKAGAAGKVETRSEAIQGSLSLKDCLARALKDNPLLAEARLGVRAGGKAVESAWGRHLPKFSLDGNYTQRQDSWPFIPAQSNTISPHFSDTFATLALVMTLPIYQGGQVAASIDLARIRETLQEETLALTRNEVMANTINTYNKILQVQKLREAAQSSVTALETQQQNAQLFFDVGRIAKVDLLKVEVQLANERQRLLSIDEGLTNLAGTLFYLMGQPAAGPVAVPTLSDQLTLSEVDVDFDQGLATAQKRRPEYRIAEISIREAGLNQNLARGKLLPTVGTFAGYMDQYGFNPWYKESNWFGGINLNLPLFEKSFYDDLAKERILVDKAEKHFAAVGNQLRLDLQTSLSSLKESRNRVLTSMKAVDQGEESFRIEQKKYASGAGAAVDMLFAQSAYVTAVANHTQALFDYNAAIVAYWKVTGTLEDCLQ
ncbi:MAG: TolC family protein [Deltaproteobacteria bacterium]|nr:TolC family protein [Deltaproteobacteria bacterium]